MQCLEEWFSKDASWHRSQLPGEYRDVGDRPELLDGE